MKKVNNPNRRQEELLRYLTAHGEVSTQNILTEFQIAKSTLSEDIKYLRSKGYPITGRHGFLSLKQDENAGIVSYYEKLSPKTIRKWIILYNANLYYNEDERYLYTLTDLYNFCNTMYLNLAPRKKAMSEQVFFEDVRELIADGYLKYSAATEKELETFKYYKNEQREIVIPVKMHVPVILDRQTAHLLYSYSESDIDSLIFSDMKQRLKKLWPDISEVPLYSPEKIYTKPVPDVLHTFMKTAYQTKCIHITCRTEHTDNPVSYKNFETAMIVFFAEQREYFLFGKNGYEFCLLPFTQITKLHEGELPNTIYDTPLHEKTKWLSHDFASDHDKEKQKWKKRYEEVFQSEYGEKIDECI